MSFFSSVFLGLIFCFPHSQLMETVFRIFWSGPLRLLRKRPYAVGKLSSGRCVSGGLGEDSHGSFLRKWWNLIVSWWWWWWWWWYFQKKWNTNEHYVWLCDSTRFIYAYIHIWFVIPNSRTPKMISFSTCSSCPLSNDVLACRRNSLKDSTTWSCSGNTCMVHTTLHSDLVTTHVLNHVSFLNFPTSLVVTNPWSLTRTSLIFIMYPGGPTARSFRLVRLQALRWYRVRVRSLAPQRRWISDAQLHDGGCDREKDMNNKKTSGCGFFWKGPVSYIVFFFGFRFSKLVGYLFWKLIVRLTNSIKMHHRCIEVIQIDCLKWMIFIYFLLISPFPFAASEYAW